MTENVGRWSAADAKCLNFWKVSQHGVFVARYVMFLDGELVLS